MQAAAALMVLMVVGALVAVAATATSTTTLRAPSIPPRGTYTRTLFEAPFLDAGIMPPQPKVESFSFH